MTDTRVWGWICDGVFRPLPRWPGFEATPPFDVQLPSGEIRRVIWKEDADATTPDLRVL